MKRLFLLCYIVCLNYVNGQAQCTSQWRIEENFSGGSAANPNTPPDCWTTGGNPLSYTFTHSDARFGGQGTLMATPIVMNTTGTLTFRARNATNRTYRGLTMDLGVWDGVTFTKLFTVDYGLPAFQNYSYDFSSHNGSGQMIAFQGSRSSGITIILDDIIYQSTCSQSTEAIAIAKDITVKLDATGNVIVNPSNVNNGSRKSCFDPIINLSLDKTLFTCDDLGPNTVTLTADDDAGHTATATAIVTVEPTFAFSSSEYFLDESGALELNTEMVVSRNSTNCDAVTYSLDKTSFDCQSTGTQTVRLTATYAAGSVFLDRTIAIRDIHPPQIKTQDIQVTIDDNTGLAVITPEMIDNGSTDNCSIASKSLSRNTFTCVDQGENEVTLILHGSEGQKVAATAKVFVNSFIPDQVVTATNNEVCFSENTSVSETISIDGSYIGAEYFLRNSKDSSVVDGPINGTGEALSFSTGTITETTTYHVYSEVPAVGRALSMPSRNEYLAVNTPGSFDYSKGYTVSMWVNETLGGISNSFNSLFYAGGATGSDIEIYQSTSNGVITVVHNRGNGGTNSFFTTAANLLPNGAYAHLTVTYDGTLAHVYVNGVEQTNSALTAPVKSAASQLTFGYLNNPAFPAFQDFEGKIDDLRIYDTARNNEDISQDMGRCLTGTESNLVLYYDFESANGTIFTDLVNSTPAQLINQNTGGLVDEGAISCSFNCHTYLTTEITIGDGVAPTVLAQNLTVDLDAFGRATITVADIDNGSNDNCTPQEELTLELSQTSFTCSHVGENTITLMATDTEGNQSSVEAVVTVNSLIADQEVSASNTAFCEGENVDDGVTISTSGSQSGTNYFLRNSDDDSIVDGPIAGTGGSLNFNTGAISTNTTYNVFAALNSSNALEFDGVDDHIPTTYIIPETSALTVEALIYPTSTKTTRFISNYSGDLSPDWGEFLVDNFEGGSPTGRALRVLLGRGGNDYSLSTGNVLTLNEWNHIAFTLNGTLLKVYVNGVLIRTGSTNGISGIRANNFPVVIGEDRNGGVTNPEFFVGKMDDVRIWTVERSAEEIADFSNTCIAGDEIGLGVNFSFEEGTGNKINDFSETSIGTLTNMDLNQVWIEGPYSCSFGCELEMSTEITITLNDTPPTVLAQAISVQLDAQGLVTIETTQIDNGSSDDCTSTPELVFTLDKTEFTCADLGENDVTLTVTDALNNQSSATVIVTVEDILPPTIQSNNLAIILDASDNATIDLADIYSGANDNCTATDDLMVSIDKNSFSCDDIGENEVIITVNDANGNTSDATVIVTVTETVVPTALANDLSVILGEDGIATITAEDVNNGSSDNCSNGESLIFTLDQSTFTCEDLGVNTVTLTATDASTNTATATAIITVADNITPTAIAQDISVRLKEDNTIIVDAAEVDGGSSDNCSTLNFDLDINTFDVSNLGENSVVLTVTDASGNSSTATATITVGPFKEDQTITFETLAAKTYGDADFTLSASTSSGLSVSFTLISGPATLSGNTVSITGAGEIVLEANQGGNDDYLSAEAVQQNFTVQKAPLTITADDQNITFGDAVPMLTFGFSDFVNGEDNTALSEQPDVSTTATDNSDAGTYDITLSGGEAANYEISLDHGILTINQATAVITISDLEQMADETPKTPTVTTDPQDLVFSITYEGSTDAPSAIGNYQVVVTIEEKNWVGTEEATFSIKEVVGIDGLELLGISVYPNPSLGLTTVEINEKGEHQMVLFDIKGAPVSRDVLSQGLNTLDLAHLPSGLYLMTINSKTGIPIGQKRIIIE